MRKVTKLTPATLKRIIAEERYKLKNTSRSNRKLTNTQLVERYLKILKLLKESQGQKSREAAKINEARKIIKRKLLKRL